MPDLGTLTVGPAVTPNMPFDAVNDFAPVTMLAYAPYGYAVNPDLPVRSMAELVAYARANPGKLNFATLGTGSSSHLAGVDLATRAGISWTYVPYKGGGQALPDVASGNAHIIGISLTSTLPFVKSGRLRLLAVSSRERLPFLPDVPTVAESGFPGFEAAFWSALLAPKNTPRPVIAKLRAEAARVMSLPEVKERLAEQATIVTLSTPEELTRFLVDENAKYKALVKTNNIKIE
jgi:tripartite-type tricarboxylate transporter receptor subunit TctC